MSSSTCRLHKVTDVIICCICPPIWECCATCRFHTELLMWNLVRAKVENCWGLRAPKIAAQARQNLLSSWQFRSPILESWFYFHSGKKEENFGARDKDHSSIWGLGASMCISDDISFESYPRKWIELVMCFFVVFWNQPIMFCKAEAVASPRTGPLGTLMLLKLQTWLMSRRCLCLRIWGSGNFDL
jgi:hypothetical protein